MSVDKIKKGSHWFYRAFCRSCGVDRGYKVEQQLEKMCRSCSAKKRMDVHGNPMSGKKHSNKEKFRKHTHLNVDYDSLRIVILPSGYKKKEYIQSCPKCNVVIGYRPIADVNRTCAPCQHDSRRVYTPEQFRLRKSISANLSSRLRARSIDKDAGASEILPFDLLDLFSHLESKFENGMTWQNYGEWELDHLVPDSWFQYKSVEDEGFKKSWSLDNLQPMWKKENASKSNRYSGLFDPNYSKELK